MSEWFAAFSRRVSRVSGHNVTLFGALDLVSGYDPNRNATSR